MALYRSLNPTEVHVQHLRLMEGDTIELTDEQFKEESARVALELVPESERAEHPPEPATDPLPDSQKAAAKEGE